ncbi:sugar phosphate nucleotidyltransferase [Kocuria rhizophila]|nr:sugar phosphate nucleotidyltransferase [Kocuria rhizophila]
MGSRPRPLSRRGRPRSSCWTSPARACPCRAPLMIRPAAPTDGPITVVTGRSHAGAVQEQLPELTDGTSCQLSPKDSAAAIGLACTLIARRDPTAIIGSFAADHVVEPAEAFQEAVLGGTGGGHGTDRDHRHHPVVPATGFGLHQGGESLGLEGAPHALAVEQFVEKPDEETARQYVASGRYTWNAGCSWHRWVSRSVPARERARAGQGAGPDRRRLGHPRARRRGGRSLAHPDQDRDRLRRGGARGRRRVLMARSPGTSRGSAALRRDQPPQQGGPCRPIPRCPSWAEQPGARGRSPPGSWSRTRAAHRADRRGGHRGGGHPGCPSRHHRGARPAREERRGLPQANGTRTSSRQPAAGPSRPRRPRPTPAPGWPRITRPGYRSRRPPPARHL